jgi:hypothetical protein
MSDVYVLQPAFLACEHLRSEPDGLTRIGALLDAALPFASADPAIDDLCAMLDGIYWVEACPEPAPDLLPAIAPLVICAA